ncbi:MAG TPA: YXWGXW repeat-containing protein, partial [Candidatus Cybelea sp.]
MNIPNVLRAAAVATLLVSFPATSSAAVFVGVTIAPPPLPVYVQPAAPLPNFMWQPGYWAWGPGGYYWVPGTWIAAPAVGLLWTPGFWGWNTGAYFWHPGYWGRTVGFYGGINYGNGYFGNGFVGGFWHG